MARRRLYAHAAARGNPQRGDELNRYRSTAIMNVKHAVSVATIAFLTSLAVSIPAQAAEPSRVVNLRDLDLSKPSDIRTLYVRIGNAAWKVCGERIPASNGPSSIENGKCRRTLMDAAVADVNHSALTAYHAKKPATVTASR
jgi:UrcA family protein